MGQRLLGDLRWFLRLVFPEPEMEEQLMELYRAWFRSRGVGPRRDPVTSHGQSARQWR